MAARIERKKATIDLRIRDLDDNLFRGAYAIPLCTTCTCCSTRSPF